MVLVLSRFAKVRRADERQWPLTRPVSRYTDHACRCGRAASRPGSARITYTPTNDGNARQENCIRLVQLAVTFNGIQRERVGEVDLQFPDYCEQRERLLASLSDVLGVSRIGEP